MSVTEQFKKDVELKDIVHVRDGLCSAILFDMTQHEGFKERLDYCLSHGISESELYQDDDGKSVSNEKTTENFSELCGQLRVNFSKERIEKLREIGIALYSDKEKFPRNEEEHQGRRITRIKEPDYDSQKKNQSPWIPIAVAAAAIVGMLLILKGK